MSNKTSKENVIGNDVDVTIITKVSKIVIEEKANDKGKETVGIVEENSKKTLIPSEGATKHIIVNGDSTQVIIDRNLKETILETEPQPIFIMNEEEVSSEDSMDSDCVSVTQQSSQNVVLESNLL